MKSFTLLLLVVSLVLGSSSGTLLPSREENAPANHLAQLHRAFSYAQSYQVEGVPSEDGHSVPHLPKCLLDSMKAIDALHQCVNSGENNHHEPPPPPTPEEDKEVRNPKSLANDYVIPGQQRDLEEGKHHRRKPHQGEHPERNHERQPHHLTDMLTKAQQKALCKSCKNQYFGAVETVESCPWLARHFDGKRARDEFKRTCHGHGCHGFFVLLPVLLALAGCTCCCCCCRRMCKRAKAKGWKCCHCKCNQAQAQQKQQQEQVEKMKKEQEQKELEEMKLAQNNAVQNVTPVAPMIVVPVAEVEERDTAGLVVNRVD